jgi:sphinganine-1-phosphate aldolase
VDAKPITRVAAGPGPLGPARVQLPPLGEDPAELLSRLALVAEREDAIAQAGRVSGSIYHGGREHFRFLGDVMGLFAHMNVLQRDMYPSATRFESEIVAMTADLLGGREVVGAPIVGVVTGGGTDSILSAVLAYRNAAVLRGVESPELVLPTSAHPAFEKAAAYFGVQLRRVCASAGYGPDPDEVARAITQRTCAVVASAGDYAWGCVDDVPRIGLIAQERGVGLHVDACLGGFILPWLERLGADLPAYDFRVPGVTSISADTHKYGYGPKGGSVVLYRDPALRHSQYFVSEGWPGGDYATPGLLGSRSQAIIGATWAAMITLGEAGYREIARAIAHTTESLRAAVSSIQELQQLGESPFLVAFTSDTVDPYLVNDRLAALGWRLNALQAPPGLHFCVTRPNTQPRVAEQFGVDLRDAVRWAKENEGRRPKTAAAYARGAGGALGSASAFAELDAMCDGG